MRSCAQRYTIASGGTWKKGDGGGMAVVESARLRASKCNGCPVGEGRARELGDVVGAMKVRRKAGREKSRRASAAREKSRPEVNPGFGTVASELEMDRENSEFEEKPMAKVKLDKKDCQECGKPFQPKRSDSNYCSKPCRDLAYRKAKDPKAGTRRPRKAARAPVANGHDAGQLGEWLALVEQVETAEKELAAFEEANPELKERAREILERLSGATA